MPIACRRFASTVRRSARVPRVSQTEPPGGGQPVVPGCEPLTALVSQLYSCGRGNGVARKMATERGPTVTGSPARHPASALVGS